jgi:phosphatidylethanolamine/phosphatidyl-N-methylethanolamine N-methyltransferase
MDNAAILTAYRRYAGVYDLLFGGIFAPGRTRAVEALGCGAGDRVLEVGVGTGLSLPYYPRDVDVVGIDLSDHMLRRARKRCRRHELRNVALHQMDAQAMSFEDESFSKISVMYIASVVPDPVAMMREIARVCRPGGDVVVVNHFSSANRLINGMERMLLPFSRTLGFIPSFPLGALMDGHPLVPVNTCSVNLFGYWKLVRFSKPAA